MVLSVSQMFIFTEKRENEMRYLSSIKIRNRASHGYFIRQTVHAHNLTIVVEAECSLITKFKTTTDVE